MNWLRPAVAAFLLLSGLVGAGLAEERRYLGTCEAPGRLALRAEIGRFREFDTEAWRDRHDGRPVRREIASSRRHFHPARPASCAHPYLPSIAVVPPASAPVRYRHYSANPAGHYPYVALCAVSWQRMAAIQPPY